MSVPSKTHRPLILKSTFENFGAHPALDRAVDQFLGKVSVPRDVDMAFFNSLMRGTGVPDAGDVGGAEWAANSQDDLGRS